MKDSTGLRIQRTFPLDKLTFRAADGDHAPGIEGYASVFNRNSAPITDWLGLSYRERVAPGAFKKTIDEADIRALWNHDPNWVLGRTKSKTLRLREDEFGLAVEIDPPATSWANDLMEVMRRGDVDQMSVGFEIVRDKWESYEDHDTGKRSDVHVLLEAKLFDVSVVTFPAFPQTEAKVRALMESGLDLSTLAAFLESQRSNEQPPAEPVLSGHSDDPEPVLSDHSLEVMRVRLELAKRR